MAKKSKKPRIHGVSFSLKRAVGVSKMKRGFARKTGIPTTKAGMRRKMAKLAAGGCFMYAVYALVGTAAIVILTWMV